MPTQPPPILMTPRPVRLSLPVQAATAWGPATLREAEAARVALCGRLARLVAPSGLGWQVVLLAGGPATGVEAMLTSLVPLNAELAILRSGAGGRRMVEMARRLEIPTTVLPGPPEGRPDLEGLRKRLRANPNLTHVAVTHLDPATGLLAPLAEIGAAVAGLGRRLVVDATLSLGALDIQADAVPGLEAVAGCSGAALGGPPGLSMVVLRDSALHAARGNARAWTLDLPIQATQAPEDLPASLVRGLTAALDALESMGGPPALEARYHAHGARVTAALLDAGYAPTLPEAVRTPVLLSVQASHPDRPDAGALRGALVDRGVRLSSAGERLLIGGLGHLQAEEIDRFVGMLPAAVRAAAVAAPTEPGS